MLEGDIDNLGDAGNMDGSLEFLHDGGLYGYRISTENWGGVTALNFDDNKEGAYTNVLHLGTGGNVGIGTPSPGTKLHLNQDNTSDGPIIRMENDSGYWDLVANDGNDSFDLELKQSEKERIIEKCDLFDSFEKKLMDKKDTLN